MHVDCPWSRLIELCRRSRRESGIRKLYSEAYAFAYINIIKMVWGAPRGIDDIVTRLRSNDANLQSLYLMRQRRFEKADARALCDALAMNTILTDLNISSHAISPEIAAMFASLLGATASLTSLDLGNSSFGDAVRTFCFLQL